MKILTAPMAGVTDYAFRKILSEYNPDIIFTEMINAESIIKNKKKTIHEITGLAGNESVQIFGNNPDYISEAAKILESNGVNHIDFNLGCPVKKIIKKSYGSELLNKPELVNEILLKTKKNLKSETKFTIKMRIGTIDFSDYMYYIKMAEDMELYYVCVHGRTKEQLYTGISNWDVIKKIKQNSKINIIGNGDIFDAKSGIEKAKYSNVDGIMIARGMLGNPWLIQEIREMMDYGTIKNRVNIKKLLDTVLQHYEYSRHFLGEEHTVFVMRKHIMWYFSRYENLKKESAKINKIKDYNEVLEVLNNIKNNNAQN